MGALRDLLRRRPRGADPGAAVWGRAGELSARGSELKYWQRTGLAKGDELYARYFEAFGVDPAALADATVADFGSGPFGGVLAALPACRIGYPIDVLASDYNEWARSPFPIVEFSGEATTVPAGSCVAVFCTNAIDHTPKPELIADEITRILRPGGTFYLHVHARTEDELNKIHPVPWEEDTVGRVFSALEIEDVRTEPEDRVNGNPYRTIYARLRKPAS